MPLRRVGLALAPALVPLVLWSSVARSEPTRVSPALRFVHEKAGERGEVGVPVRAVLRFSESPGADERARLRRAGIQLEEAPLVSGAFAAWIQTTGWDALEAWPSLVAADANLSPWIHPLDAALLQETHVTEAAASALLRTRHVLDGTGETIADVDSAVFVFHPSLFRADAGAFAWLDVDGNGAFDAGVDAIDLDRDGQVGAGETAEIVPMQQLDLRFEEVFPHNGFDATFDYLFLDRDGDHTRDFGEGFDEATPGLGEPTCVVDDANGNGVLDRSERVLRLGTSKVKKVHFRGTTFVRGDTNGQGILDYGVSLLESLDDARSPEHGTYMTAVMAGGNGSHRIRGLAPGADLVVIPEPSIEDVSFLAGEPLIAIGMPIGGAIGAPLDGSSELEQMVDALSEQGVLVSASIGNDGGAQQHAQVTIAPGEPALIPFEIVYPAQLLYVSAIHRDPSAKLSLSLVDAAGESALKLTTTAQTSPRGTSVLTGWGKQSKIPQGAQLRLSVEGASSDVRVDLFVSSDIQYGPRFLSGVTDRSTVGSPATADRTLVATGFVLHQGAAFGIDDGVEGSLAPFASRGPRIDDRALVALAAPVNPVGATFLADDPGRIAVRAWPGTSCASPQMAAAAALLHQASPEKNADELRAMLLTSARKDGFVTDDPNVWGAGKLDVAAALGLSVASAPVLSLVLDAPETVEVGESFVVRVREATTGESVEGEGVRARWDLDYDGTWDTGFEDTLERTVVAAPGRPSMAIRVDVHDAAGRLSGASSIVLTTSPSPTAPLLETPVGGTVGGGCAMSRSTASSHRGVGWLTVALSCLASRRAIRRFSRRARRAAA